MLDRTFSPRVAGVLFLIAAVSLTAPDARAVVLESQLSCQQAISKAGRLYLSATLKSKTRCDLKDYFQEGDIPCEDLKVVEALDKAHAKLTDAITEACSSLTDDALSDPRPAGLSLSAHATLASNPESRIDTLVLDFVEMLHTRSAPGSGVPLSDDAKTCQSALDAAARKHVTGAFKLLGTSCHDREDAGKTVTGETSRIVEACRELARLELDAAAAKLAGKVAKKCTPGSIAEIGSCDTLLLDRTVSTVTGCVLEKAETLAVAAIAAMHGRRGPRVIGRIEHPLPGGGTAQAVGNSGTYAVVRNSNNQIIGQMRTDPKGRVDFEVDALQSVTLCLSRNGVTNCSTEPIVVGLETVYFDTRTIEFPLAANEQLITGTLTLDDGTPCYDVSVTSEFAVRGEVGTAASGTPGSTDGHQSPLYDDQGRFVTPVLYDDGPQALYARCGTETLTVELGPPPYPPAPIVVHTTNSAPTGGAIAMTDINGQAITDPSTVHPGDVLTLSASFTDTDTLEYRWETTRGNGRFTGGTLADDRRASGQAVQWQVGEDSIQQVTMWASDGKGGVQSLVATIGPIDVGPTPSPCIAPPKLQKFLCATGYDASVPEPEGGRSDFLGRKYRNPSRNSAGDACLYYNVVDPECIDMNCDGIVDAGSDPLGKCKRMTLGGWWQKNGFDSTGLGTDVVTAWYLNSNDLGFGREMHCRVTAWSSIIAERPADAPTSAAKYLAALPPEISSSPQVQQYSKLFNLYPSAVACYVTNYTTDHCFNYPTNDPQNADLAYSGQQVFVANPLVNPPNAYGTVAMEFGPVEGFSTVGAVTKFFVYNGRTAAGKRLLSANLDGCGPKSVPELCMSCHGGDWPGDSSQWTDVDTIVAGLSTVGAVLDGIDANDTSTSDAGYIQRRDLLEKITREESGFSSFLPFDLDTYVYPAAANQASQAASLRKLNQLVLYTKPVDPVRDLTKGFYNNNFTTGTFAPWRPSAWDDDNTNAGDESDLHDEVYAKACRVCHAAHYSFNSWGAFPGSYRICDDGTGNAGGTPTMPHAKLTYLNLWKADFPQATTMSTLETWYTAYEGGFTSCD